MIARRGSRCWASSTMVLIEQTLLIEQILLPAQTLPGLQSVSNEHALTSLLDEVKAD
jgi:hypothetical protein